MAELGGGRSPFGCEKFWEASRTDFGCEILKNDIVLGRV